MNIRKILVATLISITGSIIGTAQDQIIIEPLFEYPVAPETIEGLQEKSDYLMEHFWDKMDFKNKNSVDQNALNHAFSVYVTPMQWADESKTDISVSNLIKQISKSPVLSLQFAKAAEENLYSPRAQYWNDQLLIKFLDNVISNKGVSKDRKMRYQRLRKQLSNTLRGSVPPSFDYKRTDGSTAHYAPNGVITLIEFGDPDCDDCRFAKLKMETNVSFDQLVERGKINVLFINVNPTDGWEEELKNYPSKWHVGAAEDIDDLYDLRSTPSLYVIDREGKVAVKNVNIDTAISIACSAAEQ